MNKILKTLIRLGLGWVIVKLLQKYYRKIQLQALIQTRGDGKTAIVTGGASGVGKETVKLMVSKGWKVFAVDINENGLNELVKETTAEQVIPIRVDLSSSEDCDRLGVLVKEDKTVQENGLDVLVNCAGMILPQPLLGSSYRSIELQTKINLLAPMYLAGLFSESLIKSRSGGAIVNVCSISGQVAWPWQGAYAPTKFGVEGFCDVLRREALASDLQLRVVNVLPGPIDTPMIADVETKLKEWAVKNSDHPLSRGVRKNAEGMDQYMKFISKSNPLLFVPPRAVAEAIYGASVDKKAAQKIHVIAPGFEIFFWLLYYAPTFISDRLVASM